MNLILFEPAETHLPLSRADPRAGHLLDVLKRKPNDTFDAGIVDGPRGQGTLVAIHADTLSLKFEWTTPPSTPAPITLLVGLPRPQTARDILRDTTTLGLAALHFVVTEKGDPNYAQSTLWSSGEWRRHLLAGAIQAFDTRLPVVSHGRTLADLVHALTDHTRLALDNYESPRPLSAIAVPATPVVLAIGPERGWSANERDLLRKARFDFVHLGSRVLRTETACVAALALVRAKLGLM